MTQQRSEDTRKQVMSAAVDVFCRSGYDAAGVAEICSLAGVSKGAFYHHFPSKKSLFLAIMQSWLSELDGQLGGLLHPGMPVPQALLQLIPTIESVFSDVSGRLPMFLEFLVQASRDQAVWEATIAPYQAFQSRFTEMVEQGKAEGSIKEDEDPQVAAWVIVAFSVGLLLQGVVLPNTADWESVASRGMTMLVDSMQRSKR